MLRVLSGEITCLFWDDECRGGLPFSEDEFLFEERKRS